MQGQRILLNTTQAQSASPFFFWWIWLFWLFFLAQPLFGIIQMPPSPLKGLSFVGLALFVALYLWTTWHNAYHFTRLSPPDAGPERQWWKVIGLMTLLGVLLCFVQGANALGAFIYISACMAGQLPGRRVMQMVVGMMALVLTVGVIIHAPWAIIGEMLFIIPAVGTVVYFFGQAIRTNQALQVARREITRLAVSEERLRFARDLHDLLGHTLSLITLKSELAGQLITENPAQAQQEVRDIEAAARTALQEVREAVAGYRESTLPNELDRASELLDAAGIRCTVRNDVGELAPAIAVPLTWVLREGVTNVMRHSRAKQCQITLIRQQDAVELTILDDGQGTLSAPIRPGNGLRGIVERVAAAQGRYEADAPREGGFRLVVTLPFSSSANESLRLFAPEQAKGARA